MHGLRTSALFAGVGGLETGLGQAGHETVFFCEVDPAAQLVLRTRFPEIRRHDDVRTLASLPATTELLTAGFPCQDLSQAGETRGIEGCQSGLVGEVFRLLRRRQIPWVVLENVPFMLQLHSGRAMRLVADALERLGYRWAYRVVDSRAFGLPQRRLRVFLVASLEVDPAELLFSEDAGEPPEESHRGFACGFYWTEGVRGLGWAVDAIPTLKGGSTIGIPSPPAIWFPEGLIAKPSLRDGERLQGFVADWTAPAEGVTKRGHRWKLVGNAVSVPVARWVGHCLRRPPQSLRVMPLPFDESRSWPPAAFGGPTEQRFEVPVSAWPCRVPRCRLDEFLHDPPEPLSHKAVSGFLKRLVSSSLRYPPEFLAALKNHQDRMVGLQLTAA